MCTNISGHRFWCIVGLGHLQPCREGSQSKGEEKRKKPPMHTNEHAPINLIKEPMFKIFLEREEKCFQKRSQLQEEMESYVLPIRALHSKKCKINEEPFQ